MSLYLLGWTRRVAQRGHNGVGFTCPACADDGEVFVIEGFRQQRATGVESFFGSGSQRVLGRTQREQAGFVYAA